MTRAEMMAESWANAIRGRGEDEWTPGERHLFEFGFEGGWRAQAAPAPGPATEEMLELCRDTIDRQWLNAPSLALCRKFRREHGRS